jgi:hypothetical protein
VPTEFGKGVESLLEQDSKPNHQVVPFTSICVNPSYWQQDWFQSSFVVFKLFLDELYSLFQVERLWLLENKSEEHPYHPDKLWGDSKNRNLGSLGCGGKIMWFYCLETGREFRITIQSHMQRSSVSVSTRLVSTVKSDTASLAAIIGGSSHLSPKLM